MISRFALAVGILAATCRPAQCGDPVTSKQMDEVIDELRRIRILLEAGARPAPVAARTTLDLSKAPWMGSKDASVVIAEIMDYECSYCRRFYSTTFPDLKKLYIDTGRVRFYVIDLPLKEHTHALLAAEAARCAAEQGGFWEAYHFLMSSASLDETAIAELGRRRGMDENRFNLCLTSRKYEQNVLESAAEASSKGISARPSFVIGQATATGVEGDVVVGAKPLGVFQRQIDALPH